MPPYKVQRFVLEYSMDVSNAVQDDGRLNVRRQHFDRQKHEHSDKTEHAKFINGTTSDAKIQQKKIQQLYEAAEPAPAPAPTASESAPPPEAIASMPSDTLVSLMNAAIKAGTFSVDGNGNIVENGARKGSTR